MVNFRNILFSSISLLIWFSAPKIVIGQEIETGVSKKLATYRKSVISKVNYKLMFDVPGEKNEKIATTAVLTFNLTANDKTLQLDFKEEKSKLRTLVVNGKTVPIQHQNEHLLIAGKYLKKGTNQISIAFQAGEGALNRNADYLYTLFVPDRARTVFPCFDQPDLKATYDLTLKVPADWKAIANASLKEVKVLNNRKTYEFVKSDILSTYLFSFVAGRFEQQFGKVGKYKSDFLYRETDTAKLKLA